MPLPARRGDCEGREELSGEPSCRSDRAAEGNAHGDHGFREERRARDDDRASRPLKHLIVYKHPDQNVPFWSQLTVDSDECALFFKDGRYVGALPPGRHTLQTQNIPFLNNIVNKFRAGTSSSPRSSSSRRRRSASIPFGGPLESMEDPLLFEFVTPRIFGEFALVVTDPVRFIIGYHGQAAGAQDNDSDPQLDEGQVLHEREDGHRARSARSSRRACSTSAG